MIDPSKDQQRFIASRMSKLLADYVTAFPEGQLEDNETIALMTVFSASGALLIKRHGQTTFERLVRKVRDAIVS